MNVDFSKAGITKIVDTLNNQWDEKEFFEIIIEGMGIQIPMCADSVNAIEYALKDIFISDITGESTQGNLTAVAEIMDKKFDALP